MLKITSMHIYGYGKLVDFHIDHLSKLQVFFGENEAGKSTLMSFIHSVLFGFPTKQQAALRYEPKSHSSYGGRLILETDCGEVIVERVKGKSSGDVKVILEDGTLGGEELLAQLLENMDKLMFQSIFSFNLQGLQEVHRLKGEDIGKYLVAAGTVGTDTLLHTEQQLQRELDQLFKPNGRKPKLNERIRELREKEKELNLAKQQNARYESLQMERDKHQLKMRELEEKVIRNSIEKQKLEDLLKKWPLITEYRRIKEQLEALGSISFPIDGLNRYEKFADQLLSATSRLAAINERMENTQIQIRDHAPFSPFESFALKAESLIAEWPHHMREKQEVADMQRQLSENKERTAELGRELNLPLDKVHSIQSIDLGIDMKGRLREALQQYIRLDSQLKDWQAQLKVEESRYKEIEVKCKDIEGLLITESEFKELEKKQEQWQSSERLMYEKSILEKNLEDAKEKSRLDELNKKKEKNRLYAGSSLFLFICLGLLMWSIQSLQWIVTGVISLAVMYVVFFFTTINGKLKTSDQEVDKIQRRLKELTDSICISEKDRGHEYKQQLLLREEWKQNYMLLTSQQQRIEHLEKQCSETWNTFETTKLELRNMKQELGLHHDFSETRLEDAFDLLRELMHLHNQMEKTAERLDEKLMNQREYLLTLVELAEAADIDMTDDAEVIFCLKELASKEQEKKVIVKELHQKQKELDEEKLFIEKELVGINGELDKLYISAGVDCEEDFRKKERQFAEMNTLLERKELLHTQLGKLDEDNVNTGEAEEDLREKHKALADEGERLSLQLEKLRNELAALRHELQVLEEGGTYTEKLHQFYQLKSIFNEEAKKWAEIASAKALLQDTMAAYKKDRFPKVITFAKEHLAFLTNNEYRNIHLQSDGSLLIERKDRVLFEPAELSQGTGEQLYTSLRFALVQVLQADYPFPVIIDDGFVNFDEKRTENVLKLISRLSESVQVLFFTCHDHIVDHFQEEMVVHLSKTKQVTSN